VRGASEDAAYLDLALSRGSLLASCDQALQAVTQAKDVYLLPS
jgi:hypothetical protein